MITTYFRDSETGLDYAKNRYHAPGQGRFMTPDPYSGSASAANPGSWNRYGYVQGDPVNLRDPSGLLVAAPNSRIGCLGVLQAGGTTWDELDCEDNWDEGMGGGGGPPPPPQETGCPSYDSGRAFYTCLHQSGNDFSKLASDLLTVYARLKDDSECQTFLTSRGVTMTEVNRDILSPGTTFTMANIILQLGGGELAGTAKDHVPGATQIIINSRIYMDVSPNQETNIRL